MRKECIMAKLSKKFDVANKAKAELHEYINSISTNLPYHFSKKENEDAQTACLAIIKFATIIAEKCGFDSIDIIYCLKSANSPLYKILALTDYDPEKAAEIVSKSYEITTPYYLRAQKCNDSDSESMIQDIEDGLFEQNEFTPNGLTMT